MSTDPAVTPYTTGQVAHLFNVDPKTVNRWALAGKFPGVFKTPGGHLRFPQAEIHEHLYGPPRAPRELVTV